MRKFLRSVALFLLPVFLAGTAAELYITFAPNTFNVKSAFLKRNAGSVEILALGSSHNQNAINPAFFSKPAINLAYGGQDYMLDSALFFHFAAQMPQLRFLLLEFDYHNLEFRNDCSYFRLPWYYRYYGIEPCPVPLLHKISLYASSVSFFNNYLLTAMNPLEPSYQLNDWGYMTNDFPGVFEDIQYDEAAIMADAKERLTNKHADISTENYALNTATLRHILDYCRKKGVQPILLTTPAHRSYRNAFIPEKDRRRKELQISLLQEYPELIRLDFESDVSFAPRDFKNEDHLNPRGAEKLTKKLDDYLKSIVLR